MTEIYDAYGGVVKTITVDSGNVILGYSHDVAPILENNKQLASMNDGFSPSRELRRVANVPYGVLFKWLQDDGITQLRYMRMSKGERNAWIRRKIYDPQNSHVLTAPRWSKRFA